MDMEHRLRIALQKEAEALTPKPELKEKVMDRIPFKKGRIQVKKRMVAAIVVAVLALPTAAFAGYSYLADQVFGSANVLKAHGGTQEKYDHFESKLQDARQKLSLREFTAFIGLLKDITYYNLQIADRKGNLHPEQLSADDRAEYERLLREVQPYFDKLNGE